MIKIEIKKINILKEMRSTVRGSASALKRYLFDIVIGNNEDHEKPAEKRNQYNFDFEFVKQNGDLFSIPVTFNVVIGAKLTPQKGTEYVDDEESDEILEEPRTSGAYYPNEEKVIINLELPEIFLKPKNQEQQEKFYSKISLSLASTVGHELFHDLENKVGVNRLITKKNNPMALAAKAGREVPSEKDKKRAGYQILKPKNEYNFDEDAIEEFKYLNKNKEISAFSYNIYQNSKIQKISLLESFNKFFSRKNFEAFRFAPLLDTLTKLNYLRYFKLKYPQFYEKNSADLEPMFIALKSKYLKQKEK